MNKRCYRYYGGLLASQEKWLNKMASMGYRLVRTGKLLYEFEYCSPGQYQYRLEFVAQKSKEGAEDYAYFLEDLGYRVFFKNINRDWSIGKVAVRPWADQGGHIAANSTTFNRELLIVEKMKDGKPFELHTSYEDKVNYCKQRRKPWMYLFLVSIILGIMTHTFAWGILGAVSGVGLLMYQIELFRINKWANIKEW